MRIYVGGISTETNTFSPVLMDIAQFKKGFYFLGKEIEQVKSTTKKPGNACLSGNAGGCGNHPRFCGSRCDCRTRQGR